MLVVLVLVVFALVLVVFALVLIMLVFVLVVSLRFALVSAGTAIPILTWMTSAILHLLMPMTTMWSTNHATGENKSHPQN